MCSQVLSTYPSLSSYPAEFRSATDYDRNSSDHHLLHHWKHTRTHFSCNECGALVGTIGGITHHGTTTTNQDIDSASDDSDSNDSARAPSISSFDCSGGGDGLRRSPAIRRQRPALVHMSPVHRIWSRGKAIARCAGSIGQVL